MLSTHLCHKHASQLDVEEVDQQFQHDLEENEMSFNMMVNDLAGSTFF